MSFSRFSSFTMRTHIIAFEIQLGLLLLGLIFTTLAYPNSQIHNPSKACEQYLNQEVSLDQPHDIEKLKDPRYICLSKCVLEHMGIVDSHGNVNDTMMRRVVSSFPPEIQIRIQDCFNKFKEEENLCERYTKIQQCMHHSVE